MTSRTVSHAMTLAALISVTALGACGHGHEGGTIQLTVFGESFIEDGIPAAQVSDGWDITFDTFLVSIGDAKIGQGHMNTEIVFESPSFAVFDLAQGSGGNGFAIVSTEVDGGHYDHYQYRIAPDASAVAGNAAQADMDGLKAGGFAVQVKGSATRDNDTKTFDWGFTAGTLYNHCHTEADIDDSDATVELTIHGDHLFLDDLVAAEPTLTFQLIADADSNGDNDGAITQAELAAVDITGLANYGTGSLDIDNLADFIDQQVSSMGHIAGEGHCGLQMRE